MYNNLVQSLRLVASPPDVQVSSLPPKVNFAHEIALIYSDACAEIPGIITDHPISDETTKYIHELNVKLDRMSDKKQQWTYKHLQTNPSWEGARGLAKDILKQLGERYDKPNLDFVQWMD